MMIRKLLRCPIISLFGLSSWCTWKQTKDSAGTEADLAIGNVIKLLKTGEKGEDNSPQVKALLKRRNQLAVGEDGILRRMVDNIKQIVIPNSLKGMIF